MIDISHAQELIGSEVYDPQGDKIGKVGSVYVNDETRKPEWVTVRTGLFGTKETFVPLSGAAATDQGVRVPVTKDKVKDAPQVGAEGGHMSEQEGRDLYRYYGLAPARRSPDDSAAMKEPVGPKQGPGPTEPRVEPVERATAGAVGDPAESGPGDQRPAEVKSGDQQPAASAAAGAASGAAGLGLLAAAGAASTAPAAGLASSESAPEPEKSSRPIQQHQPDTADRPDAAVQHPLAGRGGPAAAQAAPKRSVEPIAAAQAPQRPQAAAGVTSMTRSEEHLSVTTERVESGHVRLRKYVVTEEEQVRVSLSHEEVRIERRPITEAERAAVMRDAQIGEQSQEIILHAERPVVTKQTVPVETVQMRTETVTDEQIIKGEVRKERIDVEDGSARAGQQTAQRQGAQPTHPMTPRRGAVPEQATGPQQGSGIPQNTGSVQNTGSTQDTGSTRSSGAAESSGSTQSAGIQRGPVPQQNSGSQHNQAPPHSSQPEGAAATQGVSAPARVSVPDAQQDSVERRSQGVEKPRTA